SPVAALYVLALLLCMQRWAILLPVAVGLCVALLLLMLSRLRFADLPKHYLGGRRAPWDLIVAGLALLLLDAAAVVALYFTFFLLQSLADNLLAAAARNMSER